MRSRLSQKPRMSDIDRTANILAAFALALNDKVESAMRASGGGRSAAATAALIQIGSDPGLSIETLRGCLDLSHSATVRIVDQLEAAGLVERRRGAAKDSRVAALALTEAGLGEMRRSLQARRDVAQGLIGKLDAEETAALRAIVEKALPRIVASKADSDVVCRFCDLDACPQDRCPADYACRA